jgi:hypothetical protein
MADKLSYIDLAGSSGQELFAFAFPYIDRTHIHVYLDGQETEDFTFESGGMIRLDTPLSGDTTVRIRRFTPIIEPVVDFAGGSMIHPDDLDNATAQIRYLEQENNDVLDLASLTELTSNLAGIVSTINDGLATMAADLVLADQAVVDATAQVTLATTQEGLCEDQVALAAIQVGLAEDQVALAADQVALATTQATNAAASASTAATSASNAATSASGAASSKTACDTDKADCDTAVTAAQNYANDSIDAAGDSADSATASASSATAAASSASAASSSATAAASSASAAASSASDAADSATDAAASAASVATAYTAYSSTNSLATNDRVVGLSGASFTFTLTTAVGHAGRLVDLRHNGTSLTQVYTIATTSSQTIAGVDSTATTFLMYTNGESLKLVSDGANWLVLEHKAETGWTDAGAMTISATVTPPTKPTTPDLDKVYWKRRGSQCLVRYMFQESSNSGAASGSGAYLFELPTNLSFDTTIHPAVATAWATATMSEGTKSALAGSAKFWADSSSLDCDCVAFVYDTTHFQCSSSAASAVPVGSTAHAMNNSEIGFSIDLEFTCQNWRA